MLAFGRDIMQKRLRTFGAARGSIRIYGYVILS